VGVRPPASVIRVVPDLGVGVAQEQRMEAFGGGPVPHD
jgi:hypothetical protein